MPKNLTPDKQWEVGICGTFDVANYGDLLFPLIAEAELAERLGPLTLHRFSYRAKTADVWPYPVTSVTELPEIIHRLDGLLIGGGFLIRFDQDVAPGYGPPTADIHHPTGYWLTPALIALQNNVPLMWNAPGMHCNHIPAWAQPVMEKVLALSRYVSTRDEPSRLALKRITPRSIDVVPDTVFRLPRLVNNRRAPSAEFTHVATLCGLHRPYIVIQATLGLEGFVHFLKAHAAQFRDFHFLAVPIGPVLGERPDIIDADLPGVVYLPEWPSPLLLAEIIARSEAVVGHSYHLFITALGAGVPVFTRQNLSTGKYSALEHFETIFRLPENGQPEIDWFLDRLGRTETSPAVRATNPLLDAHWDAVATAIRAGPPSTAPTFNRLWQTLPTLLQDAEAHPMQMAAAVADQKAEAEKRLRAALAVHREAADEAARRLHDSALQLAAAAEHRNTLEATIEESRNSVGRLAQTLAAEQTAARLLRHEFAETLRRLDDVRQQLTTTRENRDQLHIQMEELRTSLSWRWTAPLRFLGRAFAGTFVGTFAGKTRRVIDVERIQSHALETDPFNWAAIHHLFSSADADQLAAAYPRDHFKLLAAHGGEKDYEYEARSLIGMGAGLISHPDELAPIWRALATDLLSPHYRAAMSKLTGRDLSHAWMEVNVFHYGPGASLGAHRDLPEKLVTHVLYFNREWNRGDGGCLSILRSADPADLVTEIEPIVGNSCVIVRSENSWHAVSRVARDAGCSRRSMTITFYPPGSVSSMWPPGDTTPLHRYEGL